MKIFYSAIAFLALTPLFIAAEAEKLLESVMTGGITVDLREPTFCEGSLSTELGGVITGPDIRIQAKKITYTKKNADGAPVSFIIAEEELLIEYNDYIFVGDRLEYDFEARTGVLYNGRTALEPWFFGGDKIDLRPDGSYIIHQAFVTTSEDYDPEWAIVANEASISDKRFLSAKNVQFRYMRLPILWVPSVKANLDYIFDSPLRYEFRAGSQGPRVSVAYEIFSWNRLKTFARLDYRLKRGWGGGIESYYKSSDHSESFETINFIARDAKSTGSHRVATRYRFQGIYHRDIEPQKVTIDLEYDKLSDKEMATDYRERGLDIEAAGRTQLRVRKQSDYWITNFLTRVRINGFQTTKQELPTLKTNFMPFVLGNTGVISDSKFVASYLDFQYASSIPRAHDYNSSRLVFSNRLYRPFFFGPITTTPEVGSYVIYEGNSPEKRPQWVSLGIFAWEADTRLSRSYSWLKHVIRPYARYEFYTAPTTGPNEHYIFDIDDGWVRLNMLRLGVGQNFYFKNCNGLITRYLQADLYTNAFFDSHTIPAVVPKVYGRFVWNLLPSMRQTLNTAWDFERQQLDHFNLLTEWTVNRDAAISAEYRHRSAFSWRKADPFNYFIDAFRSINQLRRSQMSDRRDTLLLHFFYRFHPSWAIELESRHGWNRQLQPSYNEYEIDLTAKLRSAWNLKVSYQHLEDDDRFTFGVTLGIDRPDKESCDCLIPFLDF